MRVINREALRKAIWDWLNQEPRIPAQDDRHMIADQLEHQADLLVSLIHRKNVAVKQAANGSCAGNGGKGEESKLAGSPALEHVEQNGVTGFPQENSQEVIESASMAQHLEQVAERSRESMLSTQEMAKALDPREVSSGKSTYLTAGLPLHEEEKLELNLTLGEQYLYPEPSTTADQIHYPVGTVFRCKPRSFIPDLQVLSVEWDTSPIKEKGVVIGHNARHLYNCKFCKNAQKQKMSEPDLLRYMYCYYLPAEIAAEQK